MSRRRNEDAQTKADTSRAGASAGGGQLGSDNVFADLGFEDAPTELVKADLALAIGECVRQRGLTQTRAARLLGTTQPKLSLLLRGRTEDVSVSRLMELLNRLDRDVDIVIKPASHGRAAGRTRVVRVDHGAREHAAAGSRLGTAKAPQRATAQHRRGSGARR